jgi:hypothetical protein
MGEPEPTTKRGPGRPATGQVPVRTIRIGDVWTEAQAVAKAEGKKFSDVVDELLKRYVARHKGKRSTAGEVPTED